MAGKLSPRQHSVALTTQPGVELAKNGVNVSIVDPCSHSSARAPDLLDDYPDESAASAAIKVIAQEVRRSSSSGIIVTASGKAVVKSEDFAGAEYRKIEPAAAVVRQVI